MSAPQKPARKRGPGRPSAIHDIAPHVQIATSPHT